MNNPDDFFIGDHVLVSYPDTKLSVSGKVSGIKIGDAGENSVELRFDGHWTFYDLAKADVEKI